MTSYLRFGDASDRYGTVFVIVQLACADREKFGVLAELPKGAEQFRWNPPCYLDNGSLIPHYDSPEHQEIERKSQRYLTWLEKHKEAS